MKVLVYEMILHIFGNSNVGIDFFVFIDLQDYTLQFTSLAPLPCQFSADLNQINTSNYIWTKWPSENMFLHAL